jgi:hypothetical protein
MLITTEQPFRRARGDRLNNQVADHIAAHRSQAAATAPEGMPG